MSTNTRIQNHSNRLKHAGRNPAREAIASPVVEKLMRLGYVVRGLIYMVMGVVALQVALGGRGTLADPQGAIADLGHTPVGSLALYGILAGLIGYALWGVVRAVFDPLQKGADLKGIVERIGYGISGVSYFLLALATYGLITGGKSAAQNGAQTAQTQQNTASILSKPWGPWLVGVVAVVVIASGIAQVVQALRNDFGQQFQPYTLRSNQRKWVERLGRFGTASRGVVFTLIGCFLFLAAYHNDPRQAQGIDGVLAAILAQPYGPWLLAIVALGLIAFGIYSAVTGTWLRVKR